MNKPFYNDQAYIAESFHLAEGITEQEARLAFFKINSYKLSVKKSFSMTKKELERIIVGTLLNFTNPGIVLANLGFFESETEN